MGDVRSTGHIGFDRPVDRLLQHVAEALGLDDVVGRAEGQPHEADRLVVGLLEDVGLVELNGGSLVRTGQVDPGGAEVLALKRDLEGERGLRSRTLHDLRQYQHADTVGRFEGQLGAAGKVEHSALHLDAGEIAAMSFPTLRRVARRRSVHAGVDAVGEPACDLIRAGVKRIAVGGGLLQRPVAADIAQMQFAAVEVQIVARAGGKVVVELGVDGRIIAANLNTTAGTLRDVVADIRAAHCQLLR